MLTRIKSTHPESQGPFVLINPQDFDPSKHELFVEEDVVSGDGSGEALPPADNVERIAPAVKHKGKK